MIDNTTFGTRTAMFVTLGCKLNFAETSTVAKPSVKEVSAAHRQERSPTCAS